MKAFSLDVTDVESVLAAVAAIVRDFGTIDVLVNNAGYGLFGPFEGTSIEQLEAVMRTNVLGLACVTQQVLPLMRERKSGTIVNVSSIAGRTATPFMTGYHATKFAVEGLSESLRYELSLHGIRVKLVEPAHFKTNFLSRSLQTTHHPAYDKAFDNFMGYARERKTLRPAGQRRLPRQSIVRQMTNRKGFDSPSAANLSWHSLRSCQTQFGALLMPRV